MSLPAALVGKRRADESHGMSGTRAYAIWVGMHARCRYPSATGYENYGGKGVTVCDRWALFSNFHADMGDPPEGHSIERDNNALGYEPGNCRWATRKEQSRNQSRLRLVEHAGRTQCLSAWAEEIGANYFVLAARLKRGWSIEKTLTAPVRAHKQYQRSAT